jgi:ribosome-binding factor A
MIKPMSNRTLRVNELIQREISAYLHTRYRREAVRITITGVQVSPDLREGRVFYSVLGGADLAGKCGRWLQARTPEIRHVVGRQVVLKNVPQLAFVYDAANVRGDRINQILDQIEAKKPSGPG